MSFLNKTQQPTGQSICTWSTGGRWRHQSCDLSAPVLTGLLPRSPPPGLYLEVLQQAAVQAWATGICPSFSAAGRGVKAALDAADTWSRPVGVATRLRAGAQTLGCCFARSADMTASDVRHRAALCRNAVVCMTALLPADVGR